MVIVLEVDLRPDDKRELREAGFDRYGINTERNGFMLYDGEKIPALSFEY
jgi:hypothetical protein